MGQRRGERFRKEERKKSEREKEGDGKEGRKGKSLSGEDEKRNIDNEIY